MSEKIDLKPVIAALNDRKAKQEAVKTEYKGKAKIKALTTAERLDRLEKLMGIDDKVGK